MRQSNGVITEDFEVIFDELMSEVSRRIRCNTLARVVEVNDKLISVQPIIKEKINTKDGTKFVTLPKISNVYCISNQSPQVGDYVACLHFDRGVGDFDIFNDLDGFIESGTHRHDISDCVAIVINTGQGYSRLGEFSGSVNVPEIKDCSELKLVVLENGVQILSNGFYRADGSSLGVKIPQASQGTVITLDLVTGDVSIPVNYSLIIYVK